MSHDRQRSLYYADLLLKKHFLLSMLKTIVVLNIIVEKVIHFFKDLLMNKMLKLTAVHLFLNTMSLMSP